MAKQIFNQNGANLNTLSPQLQAQAWLNGNILTSLDQNTVTYSAYNFTGLYQQINVQNTTSLTIPNASATIYCYQSIQLTSATGTAVTINLNAASPYMDVGMIITIWNNTTAVSTVQSSIGSSPIYPIQPDESIRLQIISVDATLGYFIILNDKESKTWAPVGSFKDVLLSNSLIDGYFERGWILYGAYTIGNSASGAHYADDRLFTLFVNSYNSCPSAIVTPPRTGDAATDWGNNATLLLPYTAGAVLGQADASTVNFIDSGDFFGEFDTSLTDQSQNAPHYHFVGEAVLGTTGGSGTAMRGNSNTKQTTTSGSSAPHNNTQPTLAVGRMIRGF